MDTFAYKAAFEQAPFAMILLDTNFIIVEVSDLFLNITQTIRENIIGKDAFKVFPDNPADITADGQAKIRASLNRVIKNKIPETLAVVKYDIPTPAADGGGFTVKYWQPSHSPILDEFNNVKYIMQVVVDVTENETLVVKLAEEEKLLKQMTDSEKRYNLLLMKSPFAFAVFKGKEMIISLANDSIKKIWNKTGQIEGRSIWEVLPELKSTSIPGLIDGVYTTGKSFYGNELLVRFQRENKVEDLYFNFIYQPYLEADETISGVTVIVYEVTAQVILKKALVDQLEMETKALMRIAETNKRFYRLLMQSPFAFAIIKGNDLVITLANDLMKSFWGKGQEVEGKTLLEVLPEIIDQPFASMFREVFGTGHPIYANEIMAKIRYDGLLKERYFNLVIQPHLEADETRSGVTLIAYEVTEMVLARKKVEESESRFQAAVAAVKGVLWTTNSKGEVDGVLQSWGELSGQRLEEYQGFGWLNAIHPDDTIPTKDAWDHAINTQEPYVIEHRIRLKDGSWGQFSVNAIPLFNKEGSVREWVGVHTDITVQRRAEESVKASEKKFKQLVDAMPQKITNADATGNVMFFNQQWVDETGLSFEELIDGGWTKSIHPGDLESTVLNWKNAVSLGSIFDMECRILNRFGEHRWNLSRAVPINNEKGEIIMWVGSTTDIHEQKEQKMHLEKAVTERTRELDDTNKILIIKNREQESRSMELFVLSGDLRVRQQELSDANVLLVKQEEEVIKINCQLSQLNKELEQRVTIRTKALAESENSFRSMMETIPQIAWTNTIELSVTFYNQRWYDYTGLNFEQTQFSVWQKVIHPDDFKDTLSQFTAILKTMDGGGFQARLLSADKDYRWHLIRLMPIKDAEGFMKLWIGTATDIEELRLLQQQKDDFISIASHELKTPVTSLKLSLQLLNELRHDLSNSIIPILIVQANRSLDRFSVLIDDLLNASKVNAGQLQLNKKQFILSELIDDCCSYVRIQGEYAVITEGDIKVKVIADAEKIEQVVINFVNNAIKYAPLSKEIRICIKTETDKVKVSVIDRGPGIPRTNQQYLFDRYYRVNNNGSHSYPGIGLGLYIAAEIIKSHNGKIGVESVIDKGSSFWFTLPL